jgi:hypothetical protein
MALRISVPQSTPHPNPPPQGGRESRCAVEIFPLPPCGGGSGWGVRRRTGYANFAPCRRPAPVSSAAIRRKRKSGCGQSFASSRSTVIVSADRCRSVPMSSTSSALIDVSSSRSMADSMTAARLRTMRGQRGWSGRGSACCDSGTMRSSAMSRASTKSSPHISRMAASPHPNPPPQGGRGFEHAFGILPLPPCGAGSGWEAVAHRGALNA